MHKCMSHVTKHLVSPEYRISRHENPHETNGLPLWQTTTQFVCLASLPKCAINAVVIVNDSQTSCMRVHTGDKWNNNIHGPSACCYWKMSINTDLSWCKSTSWWYNNCKHVPCLSNKKKQNKTYRAQSEIINKKLRYREEHSASVVLSWCTSWHLSGD